jgi:hypothetical protein
VQRAAEGTLSSGRDVGGTMMQVAADAVTGTLAAAERIGTTAARAARGIVREATGAPSGVRMPPRKVAVRAARRKGRARRPAA